MRSLKNISVVFAVFAGLLLLAGPAAATTMTKQDRALLAQMNAVRKAHGLGALRVDVTLQRAARSHSVSMLRSGAFTHGAFARRMQQFGARGPVVAENIAWGAGTRATAKAIVGMWLRSPAHRRNLLRPGFVRVGVASANGAFRGYAGARLVTANFAGR